MDEVASVAPSRDFQKRVLPSRSRRGGPGVGNCDTDIMILETFKRQSETEPLIAKDTPFFLTTDSDLAPPEASTSSTKINARGYERYFDRPEVIQGYREQQIIETPVFESIDEGEGIVGRFRPRVVETHAVDTSDDAYLSRHRKYEKFEKRQRFREKEKLQHEQYKLRERVEQLRVMDHSAFLALPASSFSPRSDGQGYGENGHLLNGSAIAEGERRKKEMLAVAETLEERYKILLPPSQKWRKYVSASTEGEEEEGTPPAATLKRDPQSNEGEPEVEEKEEQDEDLPSKQPIKLKFSFTRSAEPPVKYTRPTKKDKKPKNDTPLSSSPAERSRQLSPPAEAPRKFSLPPSAPSPMHPEIATLSIADSDQIPMNDDIDQLVELSQPKSRRHSHKSNEKPVSARKRGRPSRNKPPSPEDTGPAEALIDELATPTPESPPSTSQPLRKKRRTTIAVDESSLVPGKESGSIPLPLRADEAILGDSISAPVVRQFVSRAPPRISKKECALVLAAQNHEKGGSRVRRHRHNIAWGFKVPPDVTDLEMDFELPLWLLHDDTFQLRFSLHTDFKEDLKYAQQMNPLFKLNSRFVKGERFGTPEDERLVNALDFSHREHGEDSQSEDSGNEFEEGEEQLGGSNGVDLPEEEQDPIKNDDEEMVNQNGEALGGSNNVGEEMLIDQEEVE
ncbi:hypothetical protein F5890DRAFT_1565399 [Lentinula detonsa]|uniref:PEHE domain-containing protein n=1 Tax=Lentinula detonsa TaxID=2804962 RepID=A0AA38UT56_9AGAR|nr:hypothetical protein F5890DRAFT_1565399 [Lentinula detonsa]